MILLEIGLKEKKESILSKGNNTSRKYKQFKIIKNDRG